jgi:NADPH-dependent ferric siderophore reductase
MPSTSAVQRAGRVSHRPDRRARYPRPSEPCYALMRAQVRSVTALTPRINRICFEAPALREFPFATQDQWVKLFFPPAGAAEPEVPEGEDWYRAYLAMPDTRRPPMRTYTVRDRDDDARTVTIDFVLHGDLGPASAWASHAVPGDRIAIYGPGHAYLPPDDADWICCLGDETALPAIGAIVESADDRRTVAYVEVADDAERLPLRPTGGAQVHYLTRNGIRPSSSTMLVDTLRDLPLPRGRPYFWLAGEASKVRAMRRHLVGERGVDRRCVTFVGYWREGVREDEVGADEED